MINLETKSKFIMLGEAIRNVFRNFPKSKFLDNSQSKRQFPIKMDNNWELSNSPKGSAIPKNRTIPPHRLCLLNNLPANRKL